MIKTIFKRYEKKYILDERQYQAVLRATQKFTVPDKYGKARFAVFITTRPTGGL